MRRAFALALLPIVPTLALALTGQEYEATLQKVKRSQAQTDALVHRFAGSSGLIATVASTDEQSAREDKSAPLFRVHDQLSTMRLAPGRLLYGRVLNRLVVGSDGSPALIELDTDQGAVSGLRLMGTARQAGTPGRMMIDVAKVVLRSGRAIPLQAAALDSAGAYGLEAQVFSGKALAMGGAMASSFIAGLAASQQTQGANAFGFTTPQPTGRNAILQGMAQTAADQSKRLIDEATAEKPVLVVESQTIVTVLLQEEARF